MKTELIQGNEKSVRKKTSLDTGTKLPRCSSTVAGLQYVEEKKLSAEPGGIYINKKGEIILVTKITNKHYQYREFDYEDLDMHDSHDTEWEWWNYGGAPTFLFSSKGMNVEEVANKLIDIELKSSKMSLSLVEQTKDDNKVSESTALTTGTSKEVLVGMRSQVETKKMEGASKKKVLESLRWWKYKNIWNRPVKEDDSKALRMIEAKVRKDEI